MQAELFVDNEQVLDISSVIIWINQSVYMCYKWQKLQMCADDVQIAID